MENPKCPKCDSDQVRKSGMKVKKGGPVQQYQCRACGHVFAPGKTDEAPETGSKLTRKKAPFTYVDDKGKGR